MVKRGVVGGAAVTEEFHPGLRNSVAAYTVSLLNPKVIRDLDLHRHGLRIVERRLANFLPLEGNCSPRARCWATRTAARARIQAEASRVLPATMQLARSPPISGAAV